MYCSGNDDDIFVLYLACGGQLYACTSIRQDVFSTWHQTYDLTTMPFINSCIDNLLLNAKGPILPLFAKGRMAICPNRYFHELSTV